MLHKVVVVAAKRTGIGNFLGSLAKIPAVDLGSVVIRALLNETQLNPADISEVIMGQVLTSGVGQNPARQASLKAGIPINVPAVTINQVCGSGLKAVHFAMQEIACDDSKIIIAGGQENMSMAPHLLSGMRNGVKMGNASLVDSMLQDGLTDAYNHYHMGVTAENIIEKYQITRQMQDEFAFSSINKAILARDSGRFMDEIVPVTLPTRKAQLAIDDSLLFMVDEYIRSNTTIEGLSKLRPVFKDVGGSVTAGNSSGINDGAAAVVIMSEKMALELGLQPLAYLIAGAEVGLEPELMGLGPVYATQKVLKLSKWNINDLDLVEVNEAFAAQAIAVNNILGWNINKINVNGGAIALGHPLGASGCRILVTLLHEMRRRGLARGLATLCIGGGMGIALTVMRN